jgi:hypothetical protein
MVCEAVFGTDVQEITFHLRYNAIDPICKLNFFRGLKFGT